MTYTSPPTVLRLCKKLGFTGFDDFKQNFVRELEYLDQQQGKVDFNFPFAENDSPMRVAQNIGELYEEAVKDTMQLLRYEDLHKAVLLLKYHEEIHIFSAGTAINQAESFREKDAQDRQAGGHFQQSELPAVSGLLSVREGPCHDHFLFRRNGADAGDCPAVQTLRNTHPCADQLWRKQPDLLCGLPS